MSLSFVLVHGGGHGAWCWERLIPHLERPALAVDLPGRGSKPADLTRVGITECVDSIVSDVERAGIDRAVLVGHSMAGVIIPAVAERIPARVAHLVFLSASVPREGRASLDEVSPVIRLFAKRSIRRALSSDSPPRRGIPDRMARRMFCSDMGEEDTRYVLQRLGPEAIRVVLEKVTRAGLPSAIPRTYVKLTRDKALSPRRQDRMIANLGGADVVTIDAGHDAMISRPRELAAILNGIAALHSSSSS